MKIEDLEPKEVWKYFSEILKIPRPSKKEEKIIQYLLDFADEHNLPVKKDDVGNVLISKPATPGHENRQTVVLQSHMDMVCEKNSDVRHDFEKDPIDAYVDGEWVKAKGTTLGADDGIGIAVQLAILASDKIEHGPLECLFTVDEESGMTGAFGLQKGFFEGKILINLDSEDEGELFIGCAGGVDTMATFNFKRKKVPSGYFAMEVLVANLKGGHSGDDINKGLGNANKILNRFLWNAARKYGMRLSYIDGGNLRNAIAREAKAVILVPNTVKEEVRAEFNMFFYEIQREYKTTEPNLKMKMGTVEKPDFVLDRKTQANLLNAIYACPHGVIEMSREIPGLVETSTNLASVKMKEDDTIVIETSQRSSVESAKRDVANMVESVFLLAKAKVQRGEGYPGWTPNTDSAILKIAKESYEELFGKEPVVRAIHAGLECGLFLEKYPGLDMISFGPTLRGVHSPDERINIKTVEIFWIHLLDVLRRIPESN